MIEMLIAAHAQFSDDVLSNTKEGSRLMGLFPTMPMEHEVCFFDEYAAVEAKVRGKVALAGDKSDNPLYGKGYSPESILTDVTVPTLGRRMITASQIYWMQHLHSGDIDNVSKKLTTGFLAKQAGFKMGQKFDHIIMESLIADVRTGFLGETVVKGTAVKSVKAKLLAFDHKVLLSGLDLLRADRGEKIYFVCTQAVVNQLLGNLELLKVMPSGIATTGMFTDPLLGVTFVILHPEFINNKALGFLVAESAITVGKVSGAYMNKIDEDKNHHYSPFVYIRDSIGAVRMNDSKVAVFEVAA